MATNAAAAKTSARAARAPRRERATRAPKNSRDASPIIDPDYVAPDFSESRQTRIGSSFIEQFVAGHDASDVLRELVQNEYDGGGETLTLTFGSQGLEVTGTGGGIDQQGWDRLSVIVGTGSVVGSDGAETVAPKANGIGSKNFGLRSLFRFGDQIYVRSGGLVGLLDLTTQETGLRPDPAWDQRPGVRLNVSYRLSATERLEAFTIEREQHALALMEARMPDTLLKLALDGKRRGLRGVTIRSVRAGRSLEWRQDAKSIPTKLRGVTIVARKGRLDTGSDATSSRHEELEFSQVVAIPAKYRARQFPAYYRQGVDKLRIGVSVPLLRRRVDLGQQGSFYYPLKTPTTRTGCAISISAPFELNNDRSGLADHEWNEWLVAEAAALTVALLKADWFDRFGADAFKALDGDTDVSTSGFLAQVHALLASEACWPTADKGKGKARFTTAPSLVLPEYPALRQFVGDDALLDPRLGDDAALRAFAAARGARTFSIASLVRLRCAADNANTIATKLEHDADLYYPEYAATMGEPGMQALQAAALSELSRHLSNPNRDDLRDSPSTLTASGELRAARELLIVTADLWAECPEPVSNRLHSDLVAHKAIARYCEPYDEDQWLIAAAGRAANASDDDPERALLYRLLLKREAPLSRRAAAALRGAPVLCNQRGAWVAPAEMVMLPGALGRLLQPYVDAPAREIAAKRGLIGALRIRAKLNGDDLVRFAAGLAWRPEAADQFEKLASDHARLLTPAIAQRLRALPCLRARSGKLMAPKALHLDTPANRLCIGDDDRLVGRSNDILHAKLKIRGEPNADTILAILDEHRAAARAPARPHLMYPALVDAMRRERRPKREFAAAPICWVDDRYHAPADILLGPRAPAPLVAVIPTYRPADDIARAYAELGAATQATDAHWTRFFLHVSEEWASQQPQEPRRRRLLNEAYELRGALGLPPDCEAAACLLDDRGRLFDLGQLRANRLVEPDFPALQEALRAADSKIGIIAGGERGRAFFTRLGIRPLSAIAGTGAPIFGPAGRPKLWYQPKHGERVLAMLHRPIFARALFELAHRQRFAQGFTPADADTVADRVAAISTIEFFQSIGRRYTVDGVTVQLGVEVAVAEPQIGLIAPRNLQEFRFMLADALAEIAGASSAAAARTLASALLPLVLCTTSDDLRAYLDRAGFAGHARWGGADGDDPVDTDTDDDVEEDALRQVFDALDTKGPREDEPPPVEPVAPTPTPGPTPAPPSPPAAPLPLPALDKVSLDVQDASGATIEARTETRSGGGGSGAWFPPTPAEVARAAELGQRGEELVYRLELERVRQMGHENPEAYVIWTSRDNPGADHDIRSIDKDGRPRWIEVKSTTGVDGRFEWSRREFEKALHERERYELWRVYQVSGCAPVAKCFRNPAKMIGAQRIALELGVLRANIECLR